MADFKNKLGQRHRYSSTNRFLYLVGEAFRHHGWRIEVEPRINDIKLGFLIEKGQLCYVVELKSVSDGKRARLLPLLSMAILQSRAAARPDSHLRPLAVIMAPRIEDSVAEELRQFAFAHAPEVALGVIDFEGLRRFWGPGLEELNSIRPPELQERVLKSDDSAAHLFSDLNQWLLKVILGQRLPQELIHVPRGEFRNASQLASAAGVSVMSAFRFVRQLESDGFLDSSAHRLGIGNVERLLNRWQGALLRQQREIPYRWIIRGGSDERLLNAVRAYQQSVDQGYGDGGAEDQGLYSPKARLCLGGFIAASQFGFGHVSGVPPLLYLERIGSELPRKLGLARVEDNRPADVFIRIPAFKESVYRAAVMREGVQVSDILQIWLDSSMNPARGAEQANLIKSRVLYPLFQENS
jgi:hypothetical protein